MFERRTMVSCDYISVHSVLTWFTALLDLCPSYFWLIKCATFSGVKRNSCISEDDHALKCPRTDPGTQQPSYYGGMIPTFPLHPAYPMITNMPYAGTIPFLVSHPWAHTGLLSVYPLQGNT